MKTRQIFVDESGRSARWVMLMELAVAVAAVVLAVLVMLALLSIE